MSTPALEATEKIAAYWEQRAQRFASVQQGRPAVCSYGMPGFYNAYIDSVQRLALQPWIDSVAARSALDIGCGVGRWSLMLAARGIDVTGLDLSPTMTAEAATRAERLGFADQCRFVTGDAASLDLGLRFDAIFVVTVLQHIRGERRLAEAVQGLSRHLAPGGTIVALEAAPSKRSARCDHAVFEARGVEEYLAAFRSAGLVATAITGVDPAPFKTAYLPLHQRLPGPLATGCLAAITAMSWPIDAMFGRRWASQSWHKVMVLKRADEAGP